MNHHFGKTLVTGAAMLLPFLSAYGQVKLTDIVVFSADANGNYSDKDTWDVWNTRPGGRFNNVWLQGSDGTFLNGPTDAGAQPDVLLNSGANSFGLYLSPGAGYPYFGMNLFFNNSSVPSISVYAPMRTSQGSSSFVADAAAHTPTVIPDFFNWLPGAGTLSLISGDQLVTLTDYFVANPSVYSRDLVQAFSTVPDGRNDYVGGFTFTVSAVPEPQVALWALGILAAGVARCRRAR